MQRKVKITRGVLFQTRRKMSEEEIKSKVAQIVEKAAGVTAPVPKKEETINAEELEWIQVHKKKFKTNISFK